MRIIHGDCLVELPKLPECSVDAICTDAPYHLVSQKQTSYPNTTQLDSPHRRTQKGFMGKAWDGGDIAFRPDVWEQCLRVLKPGGYMVSFASCRGYHRMVCAIEDAGFVIHPMLAWIFASGFPKASSASKAIDKHLGAEREIVGVQSHSTKKSEGRLHHCGEAMERTHLDVTAPATPEAAQWDGWSYGLQSLKPAMESICLAQKPMIGTGAENILEWGVGALNIDACRVVGDMASAHYGGKQGDGSKTFGQIAGNGYRTEAPVAGRWPSNILHDGSDEVVSLFPQSKGMQRATLRRGATTGRGIGYASGSIGHEVEVGYSDKGSAARFFYCCKASKSDRAGSLHPTVKPIALLRYLLTLITPPGGRVLDPFAGSGTTGQAAMELGFDCVLIEREAEYIRDIERRIGLP